MTYLWDLIWSDMWVNNNLIHPMCRLASIWYIRCVDRQSSYIISDGWADYHLIYPICELIRLICPMYELIIIWYMTYRMCELIINWYKPTFIWYISNVWTDSHSIYMMRELIIIYMMYMSVVCFACFALGQEPSRQLQPGLHSGPAEVSESFHHSIPACCF